MTTIANPPKPAAPAAEPAAETTGPDQVPAHLQARGPRSTPFIDRREPHGAFHDDGGFFDDETAPKGAR
jgi:hypothetical protein